MQHTQFGMIGRLRGTRGRSRRADRPDLRASVDERQEADGRAYRRVRAHPTPRRQSRYVIRLPAMLAELCRIVHR